KPLKRVTPADLSKAFATIARTPTVRGSAPSEQTLKHYVTTLRTFLNDLLRSGELQRSPALSLRSPTPQKQTRRAPTKDELVKIVEVAEDNERVYGLMATILRFAVNTGLRRGEILALRWSDIDFDAAMVSVNRTVTQPTGAGPVFFKAPKTEAGRRSLPVADHVVLLMRDHKRHQNEQRLAAGPAWADNDLVFCSPLGEVLDQSLVSKVACWIRDEAGVPRDVLPMHGMRHFHLSAVLKNTGNDRAAAKKRAGHASFASTERYITPDEEQDRAAAKAGSVQI
ncbi:MAG: site-specific integrase, partial [Pseudomonadota bacterium]